MEDPITAVMDEALAQVATLLYDAYAETNSFSVHPSQGLFTVGFHAEENEMWVYNKDNAALIKVPDELSPKKKQATIKPMLIRQQKQQQDQQRGQSSGDVISVGDYKFNMEDPITAVMDEALVQVATLLYDAYAETNSYSVHPSQGQFTVGFHAEENEMWVYNKDNAALIKVPDELWLKQFQDDDEVCDLHNIDDPAAAPSSPVSPAGSNSRQRRKERRAAERGAATSPAAATMQPPDTKIQEP
eukprot:scaffold93396_cov41-Cyclotella_meneghiniana.AAC.1